MNKKNLFRVMAIFFAVGIAGAFIFCDFYPEVAPMTKFFVVFFGAVIGLQCIPAALLFIGMVRGLFADNDTRVKQVSR